MSPSTAQACAAKYELSNTTIRYSRTAALHPSNHANTNSSAPVKMTANKSTRQHAYAHSMKNHNIATLILLSSLFFSSVANATRHDSCSPIPTGTVIGDLGGRPIVIESRSIVAVEYNGDSAIGQEANCQKRTKASKIRNLGFDVNYSDIKNQSGAPTKKTEFQKSEREIRVRVTLSAGEDYPGDGYMQRATAANLQRQSHPMFIYKKSEHKQHSLEIYTQTELDPKTSKPFSESIVGEDIYISRDAQGNTLARIHCSNRPVRSPPCRHSFSLEPNIRISVHMSYSREILSDWKSIQEYITNWINQIPNK